MNVFETAKAQMEETPTERLLRRKRAQAQGVRMKEFVGSQFYIDEILPLIEKQKKNALIQANQQLAQPGSTHAMLAACVSWHFAFQTLHDLLIEIADQANIDVTDEMPAGDGPDVSQ